jgi:exodeoxyribonuclease V alpha subunit
MGSMIIMNAHWINGGEFPKIDTAVQSQDFYFVERNEPEATLEAILELVTKKIPSRFGMHPINEIQVPTPMHKAFNQRNSSEILGQKKIGVLGSDF